MKIVSRNMPHGNVATGNIKDPAIRDAVMRLNENAVSLKRQLEELQRAVLELQRKKV